VRLKRRAEFLAVRGGRRWSGPAFLIEAKARRAASGDVVSDPEARFGFTITKKLGGAVARNRIRRRLGHALREARLAITPLALDYVVVARAPALDRNYADLVADFRRALEDLKKAPTRPPPRKERQTSGPTPT
jgi:ribonuclease P protein component